MSSKYNLNKRRIIPFVAAICLFLALFYIVLNQIDRKMDALQRAELEQSHQEQAVSPETAIPSDAEAETVFYNHERYVLRDDLETVLILGLDKFTDQLTSDGTAFVNDQQADFLLLAVIDEYRRSYQLIHINRDTMTSVPVLDLHGNVVGNRTEQVTLAHTYGSGKRDSCENTAQAVSNLLLGIPVDHYLSLTMDAVGQLNDLVGGVTLTVAESMSPLDETQPIGGLVPGETVTLNREQALLYIRARGSLKDNTNLTRMERQRQYMGLLQKAAVERMQEDDDFPVKAMLSVADYMISDCSVYDLADLAHLLSSYSSDEILTIQGETSEVDGHIQFQADPDALRKQIIELFYKKADS